MEEYFYRENKNDNAQKMKFSIKDFFSKCDQIRRKLQIWSHLLKKSLMENFVFCALWLMRKLLNPFQTSVAFHIETSHLFSRAEQMTGFYMKHNTGFKWINVIASLLQISFKS